MPHILMFVQKPYPNDHAVLENVFTYYLPKDGFQPVWVLQPKTPQQNGLRTSWNDTPVYVTTRKWWRRGIHRIFRSFELLNEYIRLGTIAIQEHPIDIIQARTGIPEALAGLWLAKRYKKPFVFQNSFPRELQHLDFFKKRKLGFLGEFVYRIDAILLAFIMRRAALTLAISETMRDMWRSKGIKNIEAFPLGADTRVIAEVIQPIQTPLQTVMYFGAMTAPRKLDFLLETFALVLKELPDAHLLMVGDAKGTGLEKNAERLGIRDSIRFTGQIPRKDVPQYILAARCTVSPIPPVPMYILSSPTKVLESLALGIPVVANCEIHDQRELIENSRGGYAPPYQHEEIAKALIDLLTDPENAIKRGKEGREYIVTHRSYEALSQKLIGFYEDMFKRIN